jgi:hypothetical protein
LEYATVSYDHDAIEKKDDAAGRHRIGIKEGLSIDVVELPEKTSRIIKPQVLLVPLPVAE